MSAYEAAGAGGLGITSSSEEVYKRMLWLDPCHVL